MLEYPLLESKKDSLSSTHTVCPQTLRPEEPGRSCGLLPTGLVPLQLVRCFEVGSPVVFSVLILRDEPSVFPASTPFQALSPPPYSSSPPPLPTLTPKVPGLPLSPEGWLTLLFLWQHVPVLSDKQLKAAAGVSRCERILFGCSMTTLFCFCFVGCHHSSTLTAACSTGVHL